MEKALGCNLFGRAMSEGTYFKRYIQRVIRSKLTNELTDSIRILFSHEILDEAVGRKKRQGTIVRTCS